jgi:hypothetical protein|tara:strand:+ start:48 stop:773 length:726 start_codon:yes stop_codon:yes gene_type:complete
MRKFLLTIFDFITPSFENKVYRWGLQNAKKDFGEDLFGYLILHPLWILPILFAVLGSINIQDSLVSVPMFFRRLILLGLYFFSVFIIIWIKILKFIRRAPGEINTAEWISDREREVKRREDEQKQKKAKRVKELKISIPKLLKEKAVKIPASDIDAFLKHQDVDEIKEVCEILYQNGKINRTGNYRYFILTEDKKKPKKASAPKSEEVDVEKELEKLKGLLDKGLITQEVYDAKKKEILGL